MQILTEKQFVHDLEFMIDTTETYNINVTCPVQYLFDEIANSQDLTNRQISIEGDKIHVICCKFVGLTNSGTCPCNQFGCEKAVKIALKKIKEYKKGKNND